MKTRRNLVVIAAGLAACMVLVWFATSIQGVEEIYEVRPQISVPEYGGDTTRVINAYERLMERYMDLTERNSARISTNVRNIARKLDSIDAKLTDLSARIAGIEKKLGIEQASKPMPEKPPTKHAQKKDCKRPLPPAAQ
jgi:hypothetical protein